MFGSGITVEGVPPVSAMFQLPGKPNAMLSVQSITSADCESENVPKQYEGLYFGYVGRIRDLLWKNRNSPDSGTRMHCRRLLHLIDKAME